MMKANSSIFYFCFFLFTFNSCIAPEEFQNFNQGPEFPTQPESINQEYKIQIQPDDELSINVYTFDRLAAAPFNIGSGVTENGSTASLSNKAPTYLVDQEGYIDFPELGRIKLSGLTISDAKSLFLQKLESYLKDPIVTIRFTNFRITVLGEVNRPATFTFPDERVTLLEAIGMAGDLTEYGDRNDILIIREQDGTRAFGNINLRDRSVFNSPFFYLKQNDVVYVKPIDQKAATVRGQSQNIIPWVTAITTFTTLIITLIR